MKLPYYIIATILFLCPACSQKEQTKQDSYEIGKYVYIDGNAIIHIRDNCFKLKFGKDEHGHSIYGKEIVDTSDFVFTDYMRLCVRCVDDRNYEHLIKISQRNKEYEIDRKWLYNHFNNAGYEMDSYELFLTNLSDPIRRKKLYDAACIEGWDVGTYNEFSQFLGFNSEEKY